MSNLTKAVVFAAVFAAVFFVADSVFAATVQFHLRHQSTVFFEGEAELPVLGTVTLTDKNGVDVGISTQSVLATLSNIDDTNDAFGLTNIEYYPAWDSLFVHCIEIQEKDTTACDNWQYVVDGAYPFVGMDKYALSGGENVWIYFGDIRKVFPSQGSQKTDNPFSLTSEQYQYEINGWAPITGYTIGIKKDDVEVATQAVDSQGDATFTVTEPGNYTAGLVEDFYFPSTAFYVDQYVPSFGPTGTAAPPPPPPAPEKVFDVTSAVEFIQTFQQSNGSIGDVLMLNDWAAIAGLDMKAYLLSDTNPGTLLTDYERRAMALLASGVNPYSGTPTNYIEKILEGFDGVQFGSRDLANDDIFALIPLTKAGYLIEDSEVQKTVSFILSWQQPNGSWSDVDNTAAAVQALLFAKDKPEVKIALDRAKLYLVSQKQEDNSFGNAYSTSWALQALQALGENVSSSSLAELQAQDGGLLQSDSLNNRIWATAYAIPAAQGESWNVILQSFEKEVVLQVQEVAEERSSASAETLLSIQAEVEKIELALTVLEPQIALLYNQHLATAQEEQRVAGLPAGQAGITQEIARVQNEIAALQSQNPAGEILEAETEQEAELQALAITEERSSASAEIETASVEGAFQTSGGLGARQFALLIVAAFAIFLLAGGTNLVSPLLRKLVMKV